MFNGEQNGYRKSPNLFSPNNFWLGPFDFEKSFLICHHLYLILVDLFWLCRFEKSLRFSIWHLFYIFQERTEIQIVKDPLCLNNIMGTNYIIFKDIFMCIEQVYYLNVFPDNIGAVLYRKDKLGSFYCTENPSGKTLHHQLS